jgi:hypothetical protein
MTCRNRYDAPRSASKKTTAPSPAITPMALPSTSHFWV